MSKNLFVNENEIMHRAEMLMQTASSRYRITAQVAKRAKKIRYEELDNYDSSMMKPVIRAVVEMSDEITQPEIISSDSF